MKIDNIKNYISSPDFMNLANEMYELTINNEYPDYKNWFYNKQIKGCLTPYRNILFIKNENGNIIALCSLKKDANERKISTLFVAKEYRNQGLGSLLIEEAMKYLETTKPLITINEDKLAMFKNLITKYNWNLTEVALGIYSENVKEFCFNGKLTSLNYKEELIKVLNKIKSKAETSLQDNDRITEISIRK